MDPSVAVLLVHQEPSVQEKVTKLRLLVMTVSIPPVTPHRAMSVMMENCVRREPSEIVHQGQHVVEVLPVTAALGTTLMVEGVLVNRVN